MSLTSSGSRISRTDCGAKVTTKPIEKEKAGRVDRGQRGRIEQTQKRAERISVSQTFQSILQPTGKRVISPLDSHRPITLGWMEILTLKCTHYIPLMSSVLCVHRLKEAAVSLFKKLTNLLHASLLFWYY